MSTPKAQAEDCDVLFVHGMWHGAWCWRAFVAHFHALGLRTRAVDLPEHGERYRSAWRLKCLSLADCVDDLVSQIARFPKTPALVGHSLGCLVVEATLARLPAPPPAVVLAAPTRHRNFRHSVWDFAVGRGHFLRFLELNLRMSMWPPIATVALCREMLFRDDLPDGVVAEFHRAMRDESYRVAVELLFGLGPKPAPAAGTPVLVVGGGRDRAVRRADVERVARGHGTEAVIFDESPHDLMLSPGWEKPADHIASWLADRLGFPSRRSPTPRSVPP